MRKRTSIAGKELRGFFASPMGWIVMGLFAFLFGYFFMAHLTYFVEQSMQAQQGGGPVNVNQFMIRPLLQNVALINLFLLPMITMRTYAEEKRSGTIRLLLTSPITDTQIILGKFLGVLGFYAALLGVTMIYIGILFVFGNPEWRPVVTGVPRTAPHGRLLPVRRVVHFQHDEESGGSRRRDVRDVPGVVDHQLARPKRRSADGRVLDYLSIVWHFDDFGKGVVDTSCIT